jgi:two-component system response regulator NreC
MVVVGDAPSGEEAIRLLDVLMAGPDSVRPNIVLMDLTMGGMNGIEATRRIKEDWPDVAVVMLTMSDDAFNLRRTFESGASGYILKDAMDSELVDALRSVAAGGRYWPSSLGRKPEERAETGAASGVALSKEEIDVLRLVAVGYSNKEISEELYISVRTVEQHKTRIMQKTGLRTRPELTRFARDAGILTPDTSP